MSSAGRQRLVLSFVAVLLAASLVTASERVHTVLAGESASGLSKKYYGNADLGELLLRYNGKSGTTLRVGDRLTIPVCETHKAKPGETWSALAQRYLGRAAASAVLAELNGFSPSEPLRSGAQVVTPVVLKHTLVKGESLTSIAERFYGDGRKAKLVQAFNRIPDGKRAGVGTMVEIPLVAFRAPDPAPAEKAAPEHAAAAVKGAQEPKASGTAEAAPKVPAETKPTVELPRFTEPLAAARRSFAEGNYDDARQRLEVLREPVGSMGSDADRRELSLLMSFVLVAFDRDDDACQAYRGAPHSAGEGALDPDTISPRIREALAKCATAGGPPPRLDSSETAPQIPPHAHEER